MPKTCGEPRRRTALDEGYSTACGDGWVSINATSLFQRAATTNQSYAYMGIRASNETDGLSFKQFRSRNAVDTTQVPYAVVVYNSYPVVGARSTSPATTCTTGATRPSINTTRPTLRAVISDPDTGTTVQAQFEWRTVSGTILGSATTGFIASGATAETTVPAGVLANGQAYAWRVRTSDGPLWSTWSSLCEFVVDTGVSGPGVSSTSYPEEHWSGAANTAGTFTFTPPPSQAVSSYLYGLNTNPPATAVTATPDGAATVTVTPNANATQTLYVRGRDQQGNLTTGLTVYRFGVGKGAEDVGAQPDATMTTAESAAMDELAPLAQQFLQNRANQITASYASSNPVPAWSEMETLIANGENDLRQEHDALAMDDLVYDTSSVVVTQGVVQLAGDQANYWLQESSDLTPPTGSEEAPTGFNADRVFIFVRNGSGWNLADQRLMPAGDIPPVTEPISEFVLPAAPDRSAFGTEPDPYSTDDPNLYGAAGAPTELDLGPTGPDPEPASVDGNDPVPGEAKVDTVPAPEAGPETGAGYTAQGIPAGLCYSCMVNYAHRWARGHNPAYRSFESRGGDCTNFVSQALKAGGWRYRNGYYRSNSYWWYAFSYPLQTYTWTGAENWSNFAPQRTTRLGSIWWVGLADIIQADWNANGIMDHTMIVTRVSSNEVYLSYHTSAQYDKPLSQIIREVRSVHPWAVYYAYRT